MGVESDQIDGGGDGSEDDELEVGDSVQRGPNADDQATEEQTISSPPTSSPQRMFRSSMKAASTSVQEVAGAVGGSGTTPADNGASAAGGRGRREANSPPPAPSSWAQSVRGRRLRQNLGQRFRRDFPPARRAAIPRSTGRRSASPPSKSAAATETAVGDSLPPPSRPPRRAAARSARREKTVQLPLHGGEVLQLPGQGRVEVAIAPDALPRGGGDEVAAEDAGPGRGLLSQPEQRGQPHPNAVPEQCDNRQDEEERQENADKFRHGCGLRATPWQTPPARVNRGAPERLL